MPPQSRTEAQPKGSAHGDQRPIKQSTGRWLHQPLEHRNDQLIESAELWLEDKRRSDAARLSIPSNLWCIRGSLYDLSDFVDKHPGGRDWLQMMQGTDCTEAYETHHINIEKADHILAKYKTGDLSFYDENFKFQKDGLYVALRSKISKHLKKKIGPSFEYQKARWIILMLWALSLILAATSSGNGKFVLAVFSGFMLHCLMGIGHNAFHQAPSWWMYVWDFSVFSSRHWQITHAISHHSYANCEVDAEGSAMEPYVYFYSNKPKNWAFVFLYGPIFYLAAPYIDAAGRLLRIITLKEKPLLAYLLPISTALLCSYIGGQQGVLCWLIQISVASFLLLLQSTLVHRTGFAWTEGDGIESSALDFAEHIARSTNDHSVGLSMWPSLLFFGLFNNHVLHHLFPAVDQSNFSQEVREILVATMKEYRVPYYPNSFPQLFLNSFSGIWRRSYNPVSRPTYAVKK